MLSVSTSSLVLSGPDDFHSPVASKISNLRRSPYFTRSAARRSEISNSSSSALSNSNYNLVVEHSVASSSSRNCSSSRVLTNSYQNLDNIAAASGTQNISNASLRGAIESRSRLVVDLCGSRADDSILRSNGGCNRIGNLELVPFERPYQAMDVGGHRWRYCSCRRLCRYMILFMSVFIPIAWYTHQHVVETQMFFNKVEAKLCRIQEQVERMKHNVEKGTKQQLETMGKDTKQKLDAVERLLQEIKSSQSGTGETISCLNSNSADKKGENEAVRVLVMHVLDEYDADKTGKTDFALESAGGSIVSTGNTQPYEPEATGASLFGIPICCSANGPRAVIQADVHPGECWAFAGSSGSVVIKLLGYVFISGVSLEHISKAISPSGQIDSAPKEFSIWSLPHGDSTNGQFFGRFIYDSDGPPLQYFDIDGDSQSYQFIELKVHSNHGNPYFTCVYRLRVHGTLDAAKSNHAGRQ